MAQNDLATPGFVFIPYAWIGLAASGGVSGPWLVHPIEMEDIKLYRLSEVLKNLRTFQMMVAFPQINQNPVHTSLFFYGVMNHPNRQVDLMPIHASLQAQGRLTMNR